MTEGQAEPTPREWLRRAMRELRGAEQAYARHNDRGGVLGVKRAAGMALHGWLLCEPKEEYGRTYVAHLAALAADPSAPDLVREAAKRLSDAVPSDTHIVMLRAPRGEAALLEAARDVLAHAYARLIHAEGAGAREP